VAFDEFYHEGDEGARRGEKTGKSGPWGQTFACPSLVRWPLALVVNNLHDFYAFILLPAIRFSHKSKPASQR
jgi:hypothetical protein